MAKASITPQRKNVHGKAKLEVGGTYTLLKFFESCLGGNVDDDLLLWPPDVFCLMCALLQKTGAYIRLASSWPPNRGRDGDKSLKIWLKDIEETGIAWWKYSSLSESGNKGAKAPKNILQWWKAVLRNGNVTLSTLEQDPTFQRKVFWNSVLQLAAAADEACCGVGALDGSLFAKPLDPDMIIKAQGMLVDTTKMGRATLCRKIPSTFASVLPKMHTPQTGITLRSISHYLAFVRSAEIRPKYHYSFGTRDLLSSTPRHGINLLLVPWPVSVEPSAFEVAPNRDQVMDGKFGFFRYSAPNVEKMRTKMKNLLTSAKRCIGRIDGVVMPELALKEGQEKILYKTIVEVEPNAFLIAGVGSKANSETGENAAVFMGKFGAFVKQPKHHRWRLEENQIENYGLGGRLDPGKSWWEDISIHSRELSFVSLTDRVTMSVLICEDLARQDPVSDVIRAVGPNLVVALLMDGPQLESRWPAHYATVLADDPGSSVLTLTSLGMAELSRPKNKPKSRVIGLWKDRLKGFRQIELPPKSDAIVLSLTFEDREEWAADGRSDECNATYLLLNGMHPITYKP